MKDWVTALVTIQTGAIAGIAALLKVADRPVNLPGAQALLIYCSLLLFLLSIISGANVLYMLPGCAQRKPAKPAENDIYSLRTVRWPLHVWTRLLWYSFVIGLVSFAIFIVVHNLPLADSVPSRGYWPIP